MNKIIAFKCLNNFNHLVTVWNLLTAVLATLFGAAVLNTSITSSLAAYFSSPTPFPFPNVYFFKCLLSESINSTVNFCFTFSQLAVKSLLLNSSLKNFSLMD